jgi:hypothetical protein
MMIRKGAVSEGGWNGVRKENRKREGGCNNE